MVAPALLALWDGGIGEAQAFFFSALICLAVAGTLLIGFNKNDVVAERASSLREVLAVMVAWWFMVPLFASLPFVLMGLGLVDSWFETVSAITTTGAWVSYEGARASAAGMIWRAELQALGGLASLVFAAAVFIRPDFIGIETVIPPFSRGDRDSYLRAMGGALRVFTPVYAGVILTVAILFLVAGATGIDAVIMALSLVSSGGFVPGDVGAYPAPMIGPLLLVLILGAINFVVVVRIFYRRHGRMRVREDAETPAFLLGAFLAAVLFWIATGDSSLRSLLVQGFNALSILSTNGVIIGEKPALVPALVTAVIGGAAVSTAGGIKILRWMVTFRQAGVEIWKLGHPNGVVRGQQAANILAIWIHFIAFTLILAVLLLGVSFFGHSFEISITTAVAVITNAGPLLSLAGEGLQDFGLFSEHLRIILAFGMILGRLELVILLVIIRRTFWSV